MINKKVTAVLTALSILFLINFESLHAGHEEVCHEENCAVCLVLQIIHNTNKISCDAGLASAVSLVFIYINILILSALLLAPATLVSQKVKLVI